VSDGERDLARERDERSESSGLAVSTRSARRSTYWSSPGGRSTRSASMGGGPASSRAGPRVTQSLGESTLGIPRIGTRPRSDCRRKKRKPLRQKPN